jgi:hypothetical protein
MNQEKIKSLHSRYNPQAEAERYIGSLLLDEKTRFFVLIEPGLGYIVAPLRKRAPGAKIIALHAAKHEKTPSSGIADAEWFPETGVSIQDFLEGEIPDSEAKEVRLLEWRPALAVYGQTYLVLIEETTAFIKRSDANAKTIKIFGRRWFRNFFKNLEFIKKVISPAPVSLPLLVTGAGPALEEAILRIKSEHNRESLFILSASSSAAALEAGEIVPNMVISTDGSSWARFHLYELFRGNGKERCCLAAALSAALPSQCETLPVLLISDGSLWQALVLNELEIPFIALPQRGTVSATALDLAFQLCEGEIFIAGMDLANSDIRSHARPYSFDRFMEEKAGRFNPVYSQTYTRSSTLKAGGSYNIYASWFEKQLDSYPRRLYSFGKNNPIFDSLETENHRSEKTQNRKFEATNPPNFKVSKIKNVNSVRAFSVLEKALQVPGLSLPIEEELKTLLFYGKTAVSRQELIDAARAAAVSNHGDKSE